MRDDDAASPIKRTGERRPRTVRLPSSDRGQTTQDFAVGIGIFLLSVAFVFSYLPSLTTPFDSTVGGAEIAQADRIGDRLVADLAESDDRTEIDTERFLETYATDETALTELGLRATDDVVFDRVSVTVETLDGTVLETDDGDPLRAETATGEGQSAASSARIVTIDDGTDLAEHDDEPAYRLVVRVW